MHPVRASLLTRVAEDAVEAPRAADDTCDDGPAVHADAHVDCAHPRDVAAEVHEVRCKGAHDEDVLGVVLGQACAEEVRVGNLMGGAEAEAAAVRCNSSCPLSPFPLLLCAPLRSC